MIFTTPNIPYLLPIGVHFVILCRQKGKTATVFKYISDFVHYYDNIRICAHRYNTVTTSKIKYFCNVENALRGLRSSLIIVDIDNVFKDVDLLAYHTAIITVNSINDFKIKYPGYYQMYLEKYPEEFI